MPAQLWERSSSAVCAVSSISSSFCWGQDPFFPACCGHPCTFFFFVGNGFCAARLGGQGVLPETTWHSLCTEGTSGRAQMKYTILFSGCRLDGFCKENPNLLLYFYTWIHSSLVPLSSFSLHLLFSDSIYPLSHVNSESLLNDDNFRHRPTGYTPISALVLPLVDIVYLFSNKFGISTRSNSTRPLIASSGVGRDQHPFSQTV